MKVLQINSVCGRGSTGRIATDLADILIKQGHDCRVAYGRGSVPEKYKDISVRIGTENDVRMHGVRTRLLDQHGFGSVRATKSFLKWVREYDPDVIHLHNIHGYYLNVELLFDYLKESGKKIVWTLHDCWAFTGHCAYFDMAKCEKWKTGCEKCGLLKSYPKCSMGSDVERNYERKRRAFTDVQDLTLVTPSKWLAGLVKQSYLKDYPVEVIRNGIDLSVFRPVEATFKSRQGLNGKTMVLGVAATWDDRKGLRDFIKLSCMLNESYRIVLVGVDKKCRQAIPEHIICIEKTENVQELVEIYSAADVLLNLTYEDNYPTVNLEAQACGTPVLTYHTGGSVESVLEEDIVAPGDLEAVVRWLSVPTHLRETKCAECFDKYSLFNRYLDLYGV